MKGFHTTTTRCLQWIISKHKRQQFWGRRPFPHVFHILWPCGGPLNLPDTIRANHLPADKLTHIKGFQQPGDLLESLLTCRLQKSVRLDKMAAWESELYCITPLLTEVPPLPKPCTLRVQLQISMNCPTLVTLGATLLLYDTPLLFRRVKGLPEPLNRTNHFSFLPSCSLPYMLMIFLNQTWSLTCT